MSSEVEQQNLAIKGMTCASCVGRVERALVRVEGVESVEVNLVSERASIVGSVDSLRLINAVQRLGFEAHAVEDVHRARQEQHVHQEAEQHRLKSQCLWALAMTCPIFIIEMGRHLFPVMEMWLNSLMGEQHLLYGIALLATIVQFGPGLTFYRSGLRSLMHLAPDMNAMVMLGTTAAWLYSMLICVVPDLFPPSNRFVYFEASAVIISLVLLGRWLEARAKGRSGASIRKLLTLQVAQARILREGVEELVHIESLTIGDELVVRAGERIPVDAHIVDGACLMDESMLTGETMPQSKSPGGKVVAGTTMLDGFITIAVSALGANTVLSQMIRMVERAQSAKLPIQALVDRVTAVFIPIVLLVAVVASISWLVFGPNPSVSYALVAGVSVVIIACPCAMGLATPISILVGIGRLAEHGLFFRRGEALQRLTHVDVVAFDKTGTLTHGKPALQSVYASSEVSIPEQDLIKIAASLEQGSIHPIAHAIVSAAQQNKLKLVQPLAVTVYPGFGISGRIDEQLVVIGSMHCLQRYAGIDQNELAQFEENLQRTSSHTHVFMAIDHVITACFVVADTIRHEAASCVQSLRAEGKEILILSGDHAQTVTALADELGIDEHKAGQLPGDKIEAIRKLQANGRKVAFVGDGMNDAPALAQADVGIAIGSGTDIAVESADLIVSTDDLRRIPFAFDVAKRCMNNIRQNLFWAFAYNSALIPIAAGVFYPLTGLTLSPMLAAFAMAASSVCVVCNALRLLRL